MPKTLRRFQKNTINADDTESNFLPSKSGVNLRNPSKSLKNSSKTLVNQSELFIQSVPPNMQPNIYNTEKTAFIERTRSQKLLKVGAVFWKFWKTFHN